MRTVIVDGHPDDLEKVKNILSDMEIELEIAGTASDGRAGYKLIVKERPDLIITDVHLPGMNGLTMLKKLRSEQIRAKVLILTGNQDFSEARQAIALGVDQYLLKPVKKNQVRHAVAQIAEKLAQEQAMEETFTVENIFAACLNGRNGKKWQLRYMMKERFGFTLDDPGAVMTVWLGSGYTQYRENVRTILESAGRTQRMSVCVLEIDIWRTLAAVVYRVSEDEREYQFAAEHIVPLLSRSVSGAVVCMWKALPHLNEMLDGMRTLRNLCEWNLGFDRGKLIRPEDIEKLEPVPLHYPVELEERLRKVVAVSDGEEIKRCFYRLYDLFRREEHAPGEIKECLIRFSMAALDAYKARNVVESEVKIQNSMQMIAEAVSWEQVRSAMEIFLGQISQDAFADSGDEELSPLVRSAIQLVRKYYDQGITLEETADRLFVSEEYLSTQFKKETGKGFAETVRGLRIERIKGLLVNTHLKLNQIAELTGYADPKYMSRVFKDAVGMLPTEYRKASH